MLPTLPGYTPRRQKFNNTVLKVIRELALTCPDIHTIEIFIEDVPSASPAPWESHSVVLGRVYPAAKTTGARTRLVIYRRPIESRSHSRVETYSIIRRVLVENVAAALHIAPTDIDPTYIP